MPRLKGIVEQEGFPKTHEQIGSELVNSANDGLDSLDIMQILIPPQKEDMVSAENLFQLLGDDEEDDLFESLPEHTRRIAILELGLKNGFTFNATLFGVPVEIVPVEPSAAGQDDTATGVREPRNPIKPFDLAAEVKGISKEELVKEQ